MPQRLILLLVLSCLVNGGCLFQSQYQVPSFNPSGAAAKAMELFDENKNGTIEGPELDKSPGLKAALAQIDKNADQALSSSEISARIQTYIAAQAALMPAQIVLRYNGSPLSNAQVTLTPEPFLDGVVKPAAGTSGADGLVMLASQDAGFAAVQPGIYRVLVSMKGPQGEEQIPATYNSATTLGLEVAVDAPSLERGMVIEMKSN